MSEQLLTIAEAAALIEPFTAPVSGVNQLADWRRARAHYRPISVYIPVPVRIRGRVFYASSEIARTVAGIAAFKARFPVN